MTNEEFWSQRKQQLASAVVKPSASGAASNEGDPAAAASEAQPGGTTTIQLTASEIKRIFLEQPSVLAKYKSIVPHQMSEVTFWTQFDFMLISC